MDTIELVQCGGLDGICLVASDSDYTPLVIRLRAAGLFVLGIGDSRSPDALVQACTVYRWLQQPGTPELPGADEPWALPKTHHGDQPTRTPASTANGTRPPTQARTDEPSALPSTPHGGEQARTPASTANGTRPQTHAVDNDPGPRLLKTWQAIAKEKGVVTLSLFVVRLQQEYPDFKPTSYGHKRLAALIRARTDLFSCTQGKQPNDINVERVPGQAPQNIRDLLVTAWQCAQKQDGWLYIATLGSQLRQIDPVFDVQQHGHKKLSELVHAHKNVFEIREGSKGQYYIRLRN
ncbi:MAG: NYN domain-containing protein [Chloroflexaceae bacterium]|nr:NYN domain-containing protein [Chloroflexaceae bacterium]